MTKLAASPHHATTAVATGWRAWFAAEGEAAAKARWDDLAAHAATANPFLESWYLGPAMAAFDSADELVLLRVEQAGQLIGLLPLVRRRSYGGHPLPHLALWLHANAFLGAPLVRAGHEAAFWRAALAWADRRPGLALFLHLEAVPLDGPVHDALAAVAASERRRLAFVRREERALLRAGPTAAAHLEAALPQKKRKELRRQRARLAEAGALAVERLTDTAGLENWTEAFLALEARGWKGRAGSALAARPETATIFRESLAAAAARGRLDRLALVLDGAPIAMLASFTDPAGGMFSFKTAFDEAYARFSPGVLLQLENLAQLDQPTFAWCDSCAAADHPMIDSLWRDRRAIGRVSVAIGGKPRRALFNRLVDLELRRSPAG